MDKRKILPLTAGLATSAMIRHDHALLMETGEDPIFTAMGMESVAERVKRAFEEIVRIHAAAMEGHNLDPQVMEEFEGTGFYSQERDAQYEEMLAAHPEAYEIVRSGIGEYPHG